MPNVDFSKQIMHDSAKEMYRRPLGAVAGGSVIRLSVAIKDVYLQKVYLVMLKGNTKTYTEMHADGINWFCEIDAPLRSGVIWYWFYIKLSDSAGIFYGAKAGESCGTGSVYWSEPPAFQLTVFDAAFYTPNWFKKSVMYQIFPDRFCKDGDETLEKGAAYHINMGREVVVHESWDEQPLYQALPGMYYYQPCDYFGGNLRGIAEKLDYLRSLGVSAVYLNPIFEAASNHRYNTGDYLKIDPILGDNESFRRLATLAGQKGIRLILDGVFSHTGDDSVYFNKKGNYDSVGAYQSKESPYYHWYTFTDYPNEYKSWWGFETLPEVDETQADWIDFVIEKDGSVIQKWLRGGASGYRLDVADELPDETIEQIREEIKHESSDNILIGEVWEDATTKQSYGKDRTYALGKGLDSVMNYPFAAAITDFLIFKKDARLLKRFLVSQSQNYPKEMYYSLMNLLSSHDIARIRTILATRVNPHEMTREQQAHFVVSAQQDEIGARLQKIAVALQFSVPGVPCIYYGDETGMNGLMDPFNRGTFQQYDENITKYYQKISAIRGKNVALQTGGVVFYAPNEHVIGVLRWCDGGVDSFENTAEDGVFITLANRSNEAQDVVIDLFANEQLMSEALYQALREAEIDGARCLLSGGQFVVSNGLLQLNIPKETVYVLELNIQ